MPHIDATLLIPPFWAHWTSILHYLILLGTVVLLTISGEKTSVLYLFILATLALATGADLYVTLLGIPQIFAFLIRIVMQIIPIVTAGMAGTEEARSFSIIVAILVAPIMITTFTSCMFPILADPRMATWC